MCAVETRHEILNKPLLNTDDLKVLFDCKHDMAYRYIEMINQWLRENGRTPLCGARKNDRKRVRTVDYLDFAGLPRELMI